MALPVWLTNTNLGSIFESTNLLKDLNTTVATDTFALVITSELALSSTLNVATKLVNVNGITAHIGEISPGTITSGEFGSALDPISGLNLGGQFTARAISSAPALLEDIIIVQIVIEGRIPTFALTGTLEIGSTTATASIAVGGIANITDLVNQINTATNNATYGVLAINNNGALKLVRANGLIASDIVVNGTGVTGGNTGLVDGTYFLGMDSFVKSFNTQRANNVNSFARADNSSGINNFASQDFTTGTWTKTNMTAALVAATFDPAGAQAYRIETDGGGATAEITADTSVMDDELRTFKATVKLEDVQWISMFTDQSGGTAWFDVTNGLVGIVNTLAAQITSLGNGWYECRIDYQATATDANDVHTIRFVTANGGTTYTVVSGDSNLIATVASHASGNYTLFMQDSLSGIGLVDATASLINFQLNGLYSTVTQPEIVANFNLIAGTSGVVAATINSRIELVGPSVLLEQGDSASADILTLLSFDTAGSALLDSPITDWLSISPTLGVLTGLIPDVLFTVNVLITVRATDAPPTASADQNFLLVIQPTEASNVISWSPGNIGSFQERTISEASIDITNFDIIKNSVNIFARSERIFDFSQIFDLEWDITRATVASYMNGEGKIVFVGNHIPRFHYELNPTSLIFDKIGTLIEPLKINHTNFSEDFTKWTTSNTSTILGFVGPDGVAGSATRFFNNTSNSTHYLLDNVSLIPSDEQMTFSVFVQAAGHTRFQLRFDGAGTNEYATFDLTLGIVEVSGAGLENKGIIKMANDWYRVWIQTSFDVSTVTGSQMVLVGSEVGDLPSYVGTIEGVLIYGAQTEPGELTSYIVSNGGRTTRQADEVTLPLLNLDYNFIIKGTSVTATNLFLQASNPASSTWTKTNTIVGSTTVKAPTGGVAQRLVDDNGGGAVTVSTAQTVSLPTTSSLSYTFSVYLKRESITWVELAHDSFDSSQSTWFDITTGTKGTQNHDIADIENVGDGWYRCWISFTTQADMAGDFRIEMTSADGVSTITADGTNAMYFWGAQAQTGIGSSILIDTTTVQVTSTLDSINSFRSIDDRQLTLLPITKDNVITSVTVDKFEQPTLIAGDNLKISNDASISGFMPSLGTHSFELVVLFKTTVILGPDLFSLTTTAAPGIGSWNIFIPILAGAELFSEWQRVQSNLLNDFNVFKPTDINFGFGRFEIVMGYGFDEAATLENLDAARDNFDKFEGLIGSIGFLPGPTYDAIFFEMEDERLYHDTSSSSFETFVDVKFGGTIRPHSFGALRNKLVTNIGFEVSENLPSWAPTWAPRLVIGYVASGQGSSVVAKYNLSPQLQTLKGRVLPIDQIIVKDRLEGFVPTNVVGSLYTMTSVGFTFQSWQRHDFDDEGGFILTQGPDGNTIKVNANTYMVDWGRDKMWATTTVETVEIIAGPEDVFSHWYTVDYQRRKIYVTEGNTFSDIQNKGNLKEYDLDTLELNQTHDMTTIPIAPDGPVVPHSSFKGIDHDTGYLVGVHTSGDGGAGVGDRWFYVYDPVNKIWITAIAFPNNSEADFEHYMARGEHPGILVIKSADGSEKATVTTEFDSNVTVTFSRTALNNFHTFPGGVWKERILSPERTFTQGVWDPEDLLQPPNRPNYAKWVGSAPGAAINSDTAYIFWESYDNIRPYSYKLNNSGIITTTIFNDIPKSALHATDDFIKKELGPGTGSRIGLDQPGYPFVDSNGDVIYFAHMGVREGEWKRTVSFKWRPSTENIIWKTDNTDTRREPPYTMSRNSIRLNGGTLTFSSRVVGGRSGAVQDYPDPSPPGRIAIPPTFPYPINTNITVTSVDLATGVQTEELGISSRASTLIMSTESWDDIENALLYQSADVVQADQHWERYYSVFNTGDTGLIVEFDVPTLTQINSTDLATVITTSDRAFDFTGLDLTTGYLIGAHAVDDDHWNYIIDPSDMTIKVEFLHADASNDGLLFEYKSYVTLTNAASGSAAVMSASTLETRVHTFPELVKQTAFTGPNPGLLYMGGPENFWNTGPLSAGAAGELWGAWISPDEIQINRYSISSAGIVTEAFNGMTILKTEVSAEEWLHTDPGPIFYYNKSDGTLIFTMKKRTSNAEFMMKWDPAVGLVWFKSVAATESTTDTARHSTVLNGDDLVIHPIDASTVDKVKIIDAIIIQDDLSSAVSDFKVGSGVWNSVNIEHTVLPNDGDFQVLHISKEEIANEPFNITPPIITEE